MEMSPLQPQAKEHKANFSTFQPSPETLPPTLEVPVSTVPTLAVCCLLTWSSWLLGFPPAYVICIPLPFPHLSPPRGTWGCTHPCRDLCRVQRSASSLLSVTLQLTSEIRSLTEAGAAVMPLLLQQGLGITAARWQAWLCKFWGARHRFSYAHSKHYL